MREGQTLFTYLHLAADRPLTEELVERKVTGIAYETVELPDRSLPLLAPMSEVAGRLAPAGRRAHPDARPGRPRRPAWAASRACTRPRSSCIGAGVAGRTPPRSPSACRPRCCCSTSNIARLRQMDAIYQGHCQTVASNAYEIERAVIDADLVIGAVLVPGAKAPKLVTNELVSRMKPGSVLVDISIDQGGCFEDSRPDHARRPDLPGARLGVLLRREHARRGPAHQHLRADQRHPALRGRAGQPRLARGARRRTRAWPWG